MTDQPTVRTDERRRHGRRLEELVRDRWRDPRGIRGLSEDLGLSRATLYSWFKGATSPDTASLTRLARLLLVSPSEVLAALEGTDQSAQLDERIRAVTHETVRGYVTPGTDDDARMLSRAPESWREPPLVKRVRSPEIRGEANSVRLEDSTPSLRYALAEHLVSRGQAARVLGLIGPQIVEWCEAGDPIGPVAQRLYKSNYSQLPVRDRDAWVGLLTTDTIARWTAARAGRGRVYDETTPVREVLPYAEDPDNFRVVSADAPSNDVVVLFNEFVAEGRELAAVLITQNGEPFGDLLGIATTWDLPRIRAATRP